MANWKDSFNLWNHLTPKRTLNLVHLYLGYSWSRWTKIPMNSAYPFSLSIEPTTACNLGCPECPSGLKQFSRPTGKIDLTVHQKILNDIKSSVFYINYYFQGEPFLHPQFLDLITQAKKENIYTATSTNAHFIDAPMALKIIDSGLDRLIISIDGLTQETYEQYRVHGKLNKVLSATKYLIDAKKERKSSTPFLIFQFLAVRANEHEIPGVFDLGKSFGIDEVRIKTAQLYDFENGNPLLPTNKKYTRYQLKKDGTYRLKGKQINACWRMWSGSVLTWDAKVVPCCFDKDATHVLGDASTTDFKAIWRGVSYKNFRKALLTDRQNIDICKNCSEGTKVWS